jgi:hypothetical protein
LQEYAGKVAFAQDSSLKLTIEAVLQKSALSPASAKTMADATTASPSHYLTSLHMRSMYQGQVSGASTDKLFQSLKTSEYSSFCWPRSFGLHISVGK